MVRSSGRLVDGWKVYFLYVVGDFVGYVVYFSNEGRFIGRTGLEVGVFRESGFFDIIGDDRISGIIYR